MGKLSDREPDVRVEGASVIKLFLEACSFILIVLIYL